ncbi:MAG: hypothetical protein A3I29_02555 [Candidatus Magasanikbacteria bacterium RIFCSPLOWO2_02_FULL_44_11]|uniref:Glycosyltransferase 2-like domain-containing protein n=1 Tax=Candidatus Magasanikbacteria bacterium RIFCSPLOWO2_02_FULL_44_11 TaxID=1798689 RepID=A0A1F6NBN3_9BACT|nr:MAG: hypothetical protein A3I29_02555 [Candidatus Magasanikbacteria bacterium RIFCSPLOWO2_02_FULL_44_11]
MRPLISVIIPIFNHAHLLERILLSLANQSYRPLEVVIVNDGSTDNFLEVMKRIQHREPFVSLHGKVFCQNNQGAAAARNRGFKESTGQFIIFWDADTVAKPEMLEKMMAVLLVHDEAAYVYSKYCFGWKKMKSREFDLKALKKFNYIDTTSLMRREVFGGFDEQLKRFQDWDLWLTLASCGKQGIFLPETLYKKIVGRRRGMSSWLPGFLYHLPWKTKQVKSYEAAQAIILKKHRLT